MAPKFLTPFQSQGNSGSYLATSFQTAIKGANQVGGLQPTTIVSYEANIEHILDGPDPAKLEKFGMSLPGRSDTTWRDQMKASRNAHTRIFTEILMSRGLNGLLVPSFAWGATDSDINLVVWPWADGQPSKIILIDDEEQLG